MNTNNGKITTWAILVLLIIVGCIYLIAQSNVGKTKAPTTETPGAHVVTVTYFCQQGMMTASYGANKVTLALENDRTLELAQSVSGSGVRYESANAVFTSKGSNAFLDENGSTTYGDCVAGTRTSTGNSYNYSDEAKTFSFQYPTIGTLTGTLGYDVSWRANTNKSGMLLAKVTIPRSVQPKTNLGESRFTVGTSSDAMAVKTCLTNAEGGTGKGTKITINGIDYIKLSMSDAGAGNLYDTTSYRTVRDGQCWALEYTIHSMQLGNYPPEAGITAYDKDAITNMLDGIVQSFTFL